MWISACTVDLNRQMVVRDSLEGEVGATNMVRLPYISRLLSNGIPINLEQLVQIRHLNASQRIKILVLSKHLGRAWFHSICSCAFYADIKKTQFFDGK